MSRAEAKITERDNMTVVHDTSVPVPIKLQAQLNDIVRLHTAIPMDLQKILYDFCNSRQFLSDYVFLISYFEKLSQERILSTLIEKLENPRLNVRTAAAIALGNAFACITPEQKTYFFTVLTTKLDAFYEPVKRSLDDPERDTVSILMIALGAIFAYLNPTQKTDLLGSLIEKLESGQWNIERYAVQALSTAYLTLREQKIDVFDKLIEKSKHSNFYINTVATTALGVIFSCLDAEQQKIDVFDQLIAKLQDNYECIVQAAIAALGAIFAYLNPVQKITALKALVEILENGNVYAVKQAAAEALSPIFIDLDSKQQAIFLKKLIEELNDAHHTVISRAAKVLCIVFVYFNPKRKKFFLEDILLNKSKDRNSVFKEATMTALGAIFAYLDCLEQKKAVLDELIKQLNNVDWRIAAVAATALGTAFAYLDVEQKKVVLDVLIAKLNNSEPMIRQAAKETLESIVLNNVLSPMQKQLLLPYPELTNTAEIKIAQAVLSFTIPCIYIFATNRPKLTDALLAVNNIFYQNFLNPTETNLIVLKDKMTDLIRVTQESQSSVGLFSGVPADQQLMEYFKLPESLKARILLKEAFGFPDESVIEFEKSLRALMCDTLNSPKPAAALTCNALDVR